MSHATRLAVRQRAHGALQAARAALAVAMRDVALVTETDESQAGLDARDGIIAVETAMADLEAYLRRGGSAASRRSTAMGDTRTCEHRWSPDNSCDDCGAQLEEVVASDAYARGRAEALEEAARMLEDNARQNEDRCRQYAVDGYTLAARSHEAVGMSRYADASRIRAMVKR